MTYTDAYKVARTMTRGNATYQQEVIASLLSDSIVYPPERTLRGNAKNYTCRYRNSFNVALDALRSAGYSISRIPGPRGGEYGAVYSI